MFTIPNNNWKEFFEQNKKELVQIEEKINTKKEASKDLKVFPPKEQIFNAFNLCDLDKIKVVIIGQDCYHGVNQANGLCFSVNDDIKHPPSLRNILKEMETDLGKKRVNSDFSDLAEQGVLLLNSSLTVQEKLAGSHLKIWESFTDKLIKYISDNNTTNLVFILWGNYAKNKKKYIRPVHQIIEGVHPSPLSANRGGFFGNEYFSKCNKFLEKNNYSPIKWI
jgi:uracil-DNA glycosylase